MGISFTTKHAFLVTLTITCITVNWADVTCPNGCSCPSVSTLQCAHIDKIPNYSAKQDIETLEIQRHNITRLAAGSLQGFSSLKNLDLSRGKIETIEIGVFDDMKESITVIILSDNKLTDIPSGIFQGIPNLRLINITKNNLKVISKDTFVNLRSLSNLFLEVNNISTFEEGSFSGVPNLDNIKMFENKLTSIPVVGLKGANKCRTLDISFNKIVEIPEDVGGQFDSLEEIDLESNPVAKMTVFPNISNSLKILNLQFVNIPSIDANAWKNVPNVEKIYLSGNNFQELQSKMFAGLQNVQTMFLMSLPKLSTIGPKAFSHLPKLKSLHLSFNKVLTQIDESAFSSANISYIHLRENQLSTIQENLINWTAVKYFSLMGNPVNCDCHMTWMLKPEYKTVRSNFSQVICALPLKHSGKGIMTLQESDLTCPKTRRQRFATGIVVAVVCFVVIALIAILFRFRKNITMRCRKYFMYRKYQNDLVFTVENDTSIGELDDGDTRPLKEIRLE